MILVIDAGNSETTVGLCDGLEVRERWRLTTDASRTPDEVFLVLHALVASLPSRPELVGAAVGSVVPSATASLSGACEKITGVPAIVVDGRSPLPIKLAVDKPLTVGADRIINTLAASRLHKRDCITADGTFLGGAIAPGVQIAGESLFRRTSKLPATELIPPKKVIGTRTDECIRAGVVLGAAESIDGLVRRIKAEWPNKAKPLVIGTGGLAERFSTICSSFDLVEPDLTLVGLAMAYEILTASSSSGHKRRK